MAEQEFSTMGSVHIEVDSGSLSKARDEVENELGSTQVEVTALPNSGRFQDRLQRAAANAEAVVEPDVDESSMGSVSLDAEMARTDGGAAGLGGDAATLEELYDQTDYLETIADEIDDLEGGAGGGGGGGGGPLDLAGDYLQYKGLRSYFGEGGGGLTVKAGKKLGKLAGFLGTGAGVVTLGSVSLAAASVYLTAEHPPDSEYTPDPGESTSDSEPLTDEELAERTKFNESDILSQQDIEEWKTEMSNLPEDEMTRSPSSITEMLENNPEKVVDIGQAPGRNMAQLTFKGGGTETVDPSKLPMGMYQTYMGLGGGNQQDAGAATTTGLFGAPTGRRPGGTHGGRARDLAFNERLYTDVMGAGSNRTRPGPGTGGRTAGPGAEVNAPVQVDVRAERPSADTVASQVIRQVEPQLKRELQQWLKREGATEISNEQQSNYQEGF